MLMSMLVVLAAQAAPPTLEQALSKRSPLLEGTPYDALYALSEDDMAAVDWEIGCSLNSGAGAFAMDLTAGSLRSIEWYGDERVDLVVVEPASLPEGTDAAGQAAALGLQLGPVVVQLRRFTWPKCHRLPPFQWLASTDRPDVLLELDGDRVTGLVLLSGRTVKALQKTETSLIVASGPTLWTVDGLWQDLARIEGYEGAAAALIQARHRRADQGPRGEERIAALRDRVGVEGLGGAVSPEDALAALQAGDAAALEAAVGAADATLAGPDPVAWLRGHAALRAAVEAAPRAAVAAQLPRVRAYEARLAAQLRNRGASDDAQGLLWSSAALALAPSEAERAALQARTDRFLLGLTPVVQGDALLADAVDEAWDDLVRRVRRPGGPGLDGPRRSAADAVGATPVRLSSTPAVTDSKSSTRRFTDRRGGNDMQHRDNSAAVAAWQAELDRLDADIAEWHRTHPDGGFHNDVTYLEQLQRFRSEQLARRPPDTRVDNDWWDVSWEVVCRSLEGTARTTVSLEGAGRQVEVVATAGPIEGCQHDAVPKLGMPAEDRRPTDRWFREEELPAALRLQVRAPARELVTAWWSERVLEGVDDPVERGIREAWLLGRGSLPVVLPTGPIDVGPPPSAEGPTDAATPSLRPPTDPELAQLIVALDARCRARGERCDSLRGICQEYGLSKITTTAAACRARVEAPYPDDYRPAPPPWLMWAGCRAWAEGDGMLQYCDTL
ncbi:MAG: hypothetical protein H6742_10370 [Alphaproteobacteria bacterium]|nr:hypothetical protein [Alphaproteobacteria bacterium]